MILQVICLSALISGALSRPEYQIAITDIEFVLFTVNNKDDGVLLNATNQRYPNIFSNEKDTIFFIHGWLDQVSSGSGVMVKDSILEKYDANVILVNWDKIATNWLYPIAQAQMEAIGGIVAYLLQEMVINGGLNLTQTTLVGHSLGAHIAGVSGEILQGRIGLIVGLDPAGPLFTSTYTKNRLTKDSAQFVQSIHTCGGRLGYFDPIGHADYYPNGGAMQPMCGILDISGECSHMKSIEYYAESVATGNFKANKCKSFTEYERGYCYGNEISYMGGLDVDKSASGTYFLETNNKPPYAKN